MGRPNQTPSFVWRGLSSHDGNLATPWTGYHGACWGAGIRVDEGKKSMSRAGDFTGRRRKERKEKDTGCLCKNSRNQGLGTPLHRSGPGRKLKSGMDGRRGHRQGTRTRAGHGAPTPAARGERTRCGPSAANAEYTRESPKGNSPGFGRGILAGHRYCRGGAGPRDLCQSASSEGGESVGPARRGKRWRR